MFKSSTKISPTFGTIKPQTIFISVDFPSPDFPLIPMVSFISKFKLLNNSIFLLGYLNFIFFNKTLSSKLTGFTLSFLSSLISSYFHKFVDLITNLI